MRWKKIACFEIFAVMTMIISTMIGVLFPYFSDFNYLFVRSRPKRQELLGYSAFVMFASLSKIRTRSSAISVVLLAITFLGGWFLLLDIFAHQKNKPTRLMHYFGRIPESFSTIYGHIRFCLIFLFYFCSAVVTLSYFSESSLNEISAKAVINLC